jgi:teichuronic acid biosynthesis glycosyltransferase TuaC
MKILTFTSLFPNRKRPLFGIFIFQRILHLATRPGNLVRVVAPVPYFPSWLPSKHWGTYAQIPRKENFGSLSVSHPRYPLIPGVLMPLHGLLMFLGCLSTVRRLHREFQFDCIDAHYVYPDGFAAVLLGRMLDLPVVLSARGTDINLFASFVTIRPMILWTLRQAAGVVAVATALKNEMINLGLPADKICVIPNGVDLQRFHPIARPEARRKLGLQQETRIVVSVGSLTEGKNHKVLVSAFAKISEDHPEYRLYILGEGPLRTELEQLIGKLRVEKQVSLVGARPNEELALWFSSADASCLVSSREGWPNVVTESIACGTPVVATRVGGIPEIIVSPELGVLVDQNLTDVASGLQLALVKDWDREALVRQAHARSWDLVAGEVEQYLASRVPRPA